MSRGSSNKFLQVINAEFTNDGLVRLVTVNWPDGTTDRFAKNYESVFSRGNLFKPGSFSAAIPEEPEDDVPSIEFSFSATETDIVQKLTNSVESPMIRLEIVLESDVDTVEAGPFDFGVNNFQVQGASVRVEAVFEPLLDLAVPQVTFTPTFFPGLFKNSSAAEFAEPNVTDLPILRTAVTSKTLTKEKYNKWNVITKQNIVSSSSVTVDGKISFDWSHLGTASGPGGPGAVDIDIDRVEFRITVNNETVFDDLLDLNSISDLSDTGTQSFSKQFQFSVPDNALFVIEVRPEIGPAFSSVSTLEFVLSNWVLKFNGRV